MKNSSKAKNDTSEWESEWCVKAKCITEVGHEKEATAGGEGDSADGVNEEVVVMSAPSPTQASPMQADDGDTALRLR